MEKRWSAMEAIFNPKAVAVIGASDNPGKLGSHVMKSLIQGRYPGKIYPVNPGKDEILGIKTYPSLFQVPDSVDLSIIVLPAEQVPRIIKECQEKDVKGIVLITAGFKEIEDKRGEVLQKEITELADQSGIKVIGPNTFGIVNLHLPLNASFTPEFSLVEKGGISFVSQSGGMSHLMAFLSLQNKVGFSKIIGLGNRCNVDFAEMVEYLIKDSQTKVIAMYMEGIDHPKRLMEVAKRGNLEKPILAYKVGRSSTSDKASQFHTGSLAGKHEIYEGAFKQAGILTVGSSEELLDAAKALTMCPLPNGNKVAVLSGQAGPGMAACDVCEMEGLLIPPFSMETQKRIEELLPPLAIRTNPVDMGPAWYDSEAIKGIVHTVLEDKNIDAIILCIMFASANRPAVGILTDLLLERRPDKPILCCFSSPAGIWDDEIKRLEGSGIPNYPAPERAAKVLSNLYRFKNRRG
ncbi:MAG: acetyl-CoA synthetase [Deltaproteobacteria bacterium CG_4_8_14_3_um_filter_45_9]|nr:MAG: acetyl-CoA synthetase [Deltaproteobacteria bacterium CG_4_8_14_3_um_filter_45_9]